MVLYLTERVIRPGLLNGIRLFDRKRSLYVRQNQWCPNVAMLEDLFRVKTHLKCGGKVFQHIPMFSLLITLDCCVEPE